MSDPLRFILKEGVAVQFDYKNYRGVTRKRYVVALNITFEATQYYPKAQFILNAFDIEKRDKRGFAMEKIQNFERVERGGSIDVDDPLDLKCGGHG